MRTIDGRHKPGRHKPGRYTPGRGKPGRRDLLVAATRLGELLDAGLSTPEALSAAAQPRDRAARMVGAAAAGVARGQSLSRALATAGAPLDRVDLALLEAGESGGDIARALALLADRLEQRAAIRKQITGALSYPAMLMLVTVVVLHGMSLFVLPSLASMYESMGIAMPTSSRILMAAGRASASHGPGVLACLLLLTSLVMTVRSRSPRLRLLCDETLLRAPLLGGMFTSFQHAAVYSVVSTLLEAGCSVTDALQMSARCTGNTAVARALELACRRIRRGVMPDTALGAGPLDPSGESAGILRVAEATGDYPGAFARLARLTACRRDRAVERFGKLAEPAAVTLMAVAVAGGVLALYQPVLGSASLLQGGTQ